MHSRLVVAVLQLVTLSVASTALADGPDLTPGARVRITPTPRVEIPGVVTVEGTGAGGPTVRSQTPFERRGDLVVTRLGDPFLAVPVPGRVLYGDYVGLTAESLLVVPKGAKAPVSIPRRAVARLEVRRQRGHAAIGAGVGALVGFGIGYALGSCDEFGCVPPLWGGVLAIPGAIAGAAVGGADESWAIVSTDRLQVAIAAPAGGRGLAIALRF